MQNPQFHPHEFNQLFMQNPYSPSSSPQNTPLDESLTISGVKHNRKPFYTGLFLSIVPLGSLLGILGFKDRQSRSYMMLGAISTAMFLVFAI
jgi:hypothetical protein